MTFLEQQDLVLAWLDDVDANYFTRAQIKLWLNNAQKETQKLVEQAFEGHFIKCVETTTVVDQREYELPSDFKRLQRLELVITGSTFVTQEVHLLNKITRNQQDLFDRKGTPQCYFFKGTQIILAPVPDAAKTLRMEYTYRLADLSADGDVSEIPKDYHEYPCVLATIDGLIRDGRDPAPMLAKKAEIELAIKRDAEERNVDMPRNVVQTNFDESNEEFW